MTSGRLVALRNAILRRAFPPHEKQSKRRLSRSKTKRSEKLPAAGPHAKPELVDPDKAPGSGTLPDEDDREIEGSTG